MPPETLRSSAHIYRLRFIRLYPSSSDFFPPGSFPFPILGFIHCALERFSLICYRVVLSGTLPSPVPLRTPATADIGCRATRCVGLPRGLEPAKIAGDSNGVLLRGRGEVTDRMSR